MIFILVGILIAVHSQSLNIAVRAFYAVFGAGLDFEIMVGFIGLGAAGLSYGTSTCCPGDPRSSCGALCLGGLVDLLVVTWVILVWAWI